MQHHTLIHPRTRPPTSSRRAFPLCDSVAASLTAARALCSLAPCRLTSSGRSAPARAVCPPPWRPALRRRT
eukprot:2353169-Pleurochrysis_carterae.AAC.3